jgi:hypothetical protein
MRNAFLIRITSCGGGTSEMYRETIREKHLCKLALTCSAVCICEVSWSFEWDTAVS